MRAHEDLSITKLNPSGSWGLVARYATKTSLKKKKLWTVYVRMKKPYLNMIMKNNVIVGANLFAICAAKAAPI
jgi:hypothetical protein